MHVGVVHVGALRVERRDQGDGGAVTQDAVGKHEETDRAPARHQLLEVRVTARDHGHDQ